MKTSRRLEAITFMFFTFCFVGCSSVNTTSADKLAGMDFSPTPQNSADHNKGIKESGWQRPLPVKKKKIKTIMEVMDSEGGGNGKVTITYYKPTTNFIYNEDPVQGTVLVRGDLEVVDFIENKVKEKIFAYTIFARKAKVSQGSMDNNSSHDHTFVYRILDKDGDGKFETLLTDSSKILIPKWVMQ